MNFASKRLVASAERFIKDNTPTLLTGIGIVTGIIAAVQVSKATPKAMQLKSELNKNEPDHSKFEELVAVAPAYAKPAFTGAFAITCICAGSCISAKRQASLASAYVMLNECYTRYRSQVAKTIDDETLDKIDADIAKSQYKKYAESRQGMKSVNPDVKMFYDEYTNLYFMSTMDEVLTAEYEINRDFALTGEVSLNHFYALLGLDPVHGGDSVGWSADDSFYEMCGYMWIDFTHIPLHVDDDTECISISFICPPMPLYYC